MSASVATLFLPVAATLAAGDQVTRVGEHEFPVAHTVTAPALMDATSGTALVSLDGPCGTRTVLVSADAPVDLLPPF